MADVILLPVIRVERPGVDLPAQTPSRHSDLSNIAELQDARRAAAHRAYLAKMIAVARAMQFDGDGPEAA